MKKILLAAAVCLGITTAINAQDYETDLAFYLNMDDSTFVDAISGEEAFTLGDTLGPNPVEGFNERVNGAASFDGETQYLEFVDSLLSIPMGIIRTTAVWLKTDNTGSAGDIISYGARGGGNHTHFHFNGSENRVRMGHWNVDIDWSPVEINDDEWHHVAVTEGEERIILYVDGEVVGDSAVAGTFESLISGIFRVGARNFANVNNTYQGTLDEVRIYSRELSAEDIAALAADYLSVQTTAAVGSLKVYPTIVESTLNISSDIEVKSLQVVNAIGQVVLESQMQKTIDVSNLNSGLYFVKTDIPNMSATKFIKK